MDEQCIADMVELGFTRLEAEIYVYLVANGSATGYRVAKALGRPNSNTYRSLTTLQAKGAILLAEGDSRVVRAVAPDELLAQINRSFNQRHQQAADHLAGLQKDETDDRTYQLTTLEQVYGRVRKMLAESREVVFLDLFPLLVPVLEPDIEAAARRGVRVAVQVYESAEIKGAEVVLQHRHDKVLENWPMQILVVVVDGFQSLLGVLDENAKQVRYCSWTASIFQSALLLGYAHSETTLSCLMSGVEQGASGADLKRERDDWRGRFPIENTPAFAVMKEQFRSTGT